MGNNFSAVRVEQLATAVVGQLKANHVFANAVTKGQDLQPEFFSGNGYANLGDTMKVSLQPTLVATEHDATSGNSPQYMTPTAASLKLDKIFTVDLEITSLDISTISESQILAYGRSAAEAIDKKIDQYLKGIAMLTPYYVLQTITSSALTKRSILELIKKANDNLLPSMDRTVALDSQTMLEIQDLEQFTTVEKRGMDGGTAWRDANLGYALGCTWLLDQNCLGEVTPADTALAVNKVGDYAAGASSIVFDGGSSSNLAAGDMVKFAGETGTPYHVVESVTWTTPATAGTMVLADVLVSTVADDAVITVKSPSQSVLVQKTGIAWGMRPLRPFNDGTSTTIVTPDGYSIRAYFDKDAAKKQEILVFDCLCGATIIDEKRIIRFPRIA